MGAAGERGQGESAPERKSAPSPRQRGDSGGQQHGNQPRGGQERQEPRRKRGDQRYAGWGDGVERALCTESLRFIPSGIPVESHHGAATIAPVIVARREQAVLFCTFAHCGPHQWPDGEVVLPPDEEIEE